MWATLLQTFAQEVEEEARTASSERLTELIVKEVAESVNSALSTTVNSVEPVDTHTHVITPRRFNYMVPHDTLEGDDLDVTPEMLKDVDKVIFNNCVKTGAVQRLH